MSGIQLVDAVLIFAALSALIPIAGWLDRRLEKRRKASDQQ